MDHCRERCRSLRLGCAWWRPCAVTANWRTARYGLTAVLWRRGGEGQGPGPGARTDVRSAHPPDLRHGGPVQMGSDQIAPAGDALEEKVPQRRLGRRLEEVAEAVGGGYCRLRMPLRLAPGVRGTEAG